MGWERERGENGWRERMRERNREGEGGEEAGKKREVGRFVMTAKPFNKI